MQKLAYSFLYTDISSITCFVAYTDFYALCVNRVGMVLLLQKLLHRSISLTKHCLDK